MANMNINRWGGFGVALGSWNLNAKQTTALAGVLLVTLVVYLRCLSNDFVSDDHAEILTNTFIGQWSLLWRSLVHDSLWFSLGQSCYYRPLKNLWAAFNFHLFGLHPAGWHALNILLHLSVTLLSFRAAQLLTDDVAAGLATALLFGLLPVHTEVVAWISASPEPLAAVFELAALCYFIQRSRQSRWSYLVPLMLFAGALLSFEGAIIFPFLIAVYIFLFEATAAPSSAVHAGNRLITAFRRSAPFLVLALVYFAVRTEILGIKRVSRRRDGESTPSRLFAAPCDASLNDSELYQDTNSSVDGRARASNHIGKWFRFHTLLPTTLDLDIHCSRELSGDSPESSAGALPVLYILVCALTPADAQCCYDG